MKDALDADGIWAAIKDAGLDLPERRTRRDLQGRLVNVFLKCEADPTGRSAVGATPCSTTPTCTGTARSRRRVGGVTASVTGDPAVFVSVAAAHQGPDGRRPGRRDRRPRPGPGHRLRPAAQS